MPITAEHDRPVDPALIVVMGESGAGKTTVGRLLATRLGLPDERGGILDVTSTSPDLLVDRAVRLLNTRHERGA